MVWALEDKHFPKDHSLRKIFNRNKIKISYSCMNGTKQIVDKDNKRILYSSKHINDTADNTNTKDTKTCNCRQKNTCPPNGNRLQSSLIYQATITRKYNSTTETYIAHTEWKYSLFVFFLSQYICMSLAQEHSTVTRPGSRPFSDCQSLENQWEFLCKDKYAPTWEEYTPK